MSFPAVFTEGTLNTQNWEHLKNTLLTSGFGVVVHGAVATEPRPTDYRAVIWIGSVEPENATADDIWYDTGAASRDFGLVSSLPASPNVSDQCTYKADATNGVYWHLIYDGSGEYPWKKIGGPPLVARADTQRERTSTSYGSLTGPLSLTTPLKGDYDIEIQTIVKTFGKQAVYLSYSIGATVASDAWAAMGFQNAGEGEINAAVTCRTRQTGISASTAITEQARSSASKAFWENRRLWLDPVRVG